MYSQQQETEVGGLEACSPSAQDECVLDENDPVLAQYRDRVNALHAKLRSLDEQDSQALECRMMLAEAQANYRGDWTLLELRRLLEQGTVEKYRSTIERHLEQFEQGPENAFTKKTMRKEHFDAALETFSERVAAVFANTYTGPATTFDKSPTNLGFANHDRDDLRRGAVFTDARSNGVVLNERQKNIIEAHEKIHGALSFNDSPMGATLRDSIDLEALARLKEEGEISRGTYHRKPDEILARMAQLRNYFGMGVNDVFTREHLQFAREHYLYDTKLNNGMTAFFACITERVEPLFLEVMNTFPM